MIVMSVLFVLENSINLFQISARANFLALSLDSIEGISLSTLQTSVVAVHRSVHAGGFARAAITAVWTDVSVGSHIWFSFFNFITHGFALALPLAMLGVEHAKSFFRFNYFHFFSKRWLQIDIISKIETMMIPGDIYCAVVSSGIRTLWTHTIVFVWVYLNQVFR